MFDELFRMLDDLEREAARPLLEITPAILGEHGLRLEKTSDFLLCCFHSADNRRCPFELHFGTGGSSHRFNFFFGLGAELYNYEPLSDESASAQIANDLERFLKSTVACERYVDKVGEPFKEVYSPSLFVVDGTQTRFWYRRRYALPFTKCNRTTVEYQPWVSTPVTWRL